MMMKVEVDQMKRKKLNQRQQIDEGLVRSEVDEHR